MASYEKSWVKANVHSCLILVIGGLAFLLKKAGLQMSVESGQVLAGLIPYPHDNIFFYYHLKAWSLINQISAIFLKIGMNEYSASIAIGVIGASISFYSVYLITLYFSKRKNLSFFITLVVIMIQLYPQSPIYPISFFGSSHNNGEMGLSCFLLTLAFMLNKNKKAFMFMIAILPAVHIVYGAWFALCYLVSIYVKNRSLRFKVDALKWPFWMGFVVTLFSFSWQKIAFNERISTTIVERVGSEGFINYVLYWGAHRRLLTDYNSVDLLSCLFLSLFFIVYFVYRNFKNKLEFNELFIVILSVLSFGSVILMQFTNYLPIVVTKVMPGRFINIVIILSVLYLLVVNTIKLKNRLLFFLYLLFVSFCMSFIGRLANYNIVPLSLGITMVVICCSQFHLLRKFFKKDITIGMGPIGLVIFFLSIMVFFRSIVNLKSLKNHNVDFSSKIADKVLYDYLYGQKKQILLAGKLGKIQLKTRSPVVIDTGSIDFIPMMPEIQARANKLLKSVYGIDLSSKPRGELPNGGIPRTHKNLWENRSEKNWKNLGDRYNFEYILTPHSWNLNLRKIMETQSLSLFIVGEVSQQPL